MARRRETPLEYMLRILNDPKVPDARRDRMANMAAPYVHPRVLPAKQGKKAKQAAAAKTASAGTQWSSDLVEIIRPN